MTEKRCSKCGEMKPLSEYSLNKQNLDGHAGVCKECRNAAARARTARNRSATTRTPSGHSMGRTASMLTVECAYDPTQMYGGMFDRASFVGTLYDGNWPDGSVWRMAAIGDADGPAALWRLHDGALREIGGSRIIEPAGTEYTPTLRVIGAAVAANN